MYERAEVIPLQVLAFVVVVEKGCMIIVGGLSLFCFCLIVSLFIYFIDRFSWLIHWSSRLIDRLVDWLVNRLVDE